MLMFCFHVSFFISYIGFGLMGAMTFKDIGGNALIMLTSSKVNI